MPLIDKILTEGPHRVYDVCNAQGKEWVLPARNMRTAMALYQPGSANGRRLKRWFPLLHRLGPVCRRLGVAVRMVQLLPELRDAIAEAFGTREFEWSIFGGTPGVHQKITMQVYSGRRLLGYVKIADSADIRRLFNHEQRVLDTLSQAEAAAGQSIAHPQILFCDRLPLSGLHVLIQTTRKTLDSAEQHAWTDAHSAYIDALESITTRQMKYEDSDFYRMLHAVDPYLPQLSAEWQALLLSRRDEIDRELAGKMLPMCISHGDFTPWNMVTLAGGDIFAFDWEYSHLSYPPGLDRWHFIIQSAIFESGRTDREILEQLSPQSDDPALKLYLMGIVSQFVVREQGHFEGDMVRSAGIWMQLLSMCK